MTAAEMRMVIAAVSYKDWQIVIAEDGQRPYLQVRFSALHVDSGERAEQRGRKWLLSTHMTRSELVATAFKAILTAEEHEAREAFLYRGQAVFGPHFDVDALADLSESGATDKRAAPTRRLLAGHLNE